MWRGDLMEGFLHYDFEGHILGGAYTWRGLFSEFCSITNLSLHHPSKNEIYYKCYFLE